MTSFRAPSQKPPVKTRNSSGRWHYHPRPARVNPRLGRGWGRCDPRPKVFFCDARRTISRIMPKFFITFWASFAQLLVKNLTGSCQVTEIWRRKRYKVRPFFARNGDLLHIRRQYRSRRGFSWSLKVRTDLSDTTTMPFNPIPNYSLRTSQ